MIPVHAAEACSDFTVHAKHGVHADSELRSQIRNAERSFTLFHISYKMLTIRAHGTCARYVRKYVRMVVVKETVYNSHGRRLSMPLYYVET